MTCPCLREKWDRQRRELAGRGFEVGWAYDGHPTPDGKREAILEMLERHGDEPSLWLLPPQIREDHIEGATENFMKGRLATLRTCCWAVYGVVAQKPEVGHLLEGQRIPMYGNREYDK